MKTSILIEFINKLKSKPKLMRKVKILAVVGLVSFMFVGGLTIWAGVSAYRYLVTSTNQSMIFLDAQNQLKSIETDFKKIHFQPLSCWNKTQSLLAIEPWFTRSVLDNLQNLKMACLESHNTICEGYECNQMKQNMNTAKGETI